MAASGLAVLRSGLAPLAPRVVHPGEAAGFSCLIQVMIASPAATSAAALSRKRRRRRAAIASRCSR